VSAPATYDLNAIFDAIADLMNGLETGVKLDGRAQIITAYSEVLGNVQAPAIVLELEDVTYDLAMGNGADGISIVATCLIQTADTKTAQRALRTFMSRQETAGVARLKAVMDEDTTLGGLVSFVQFGTVRRIGTLTYDGVDYLGAELIFEVMS
jgi:hypothetical protein